MYKRQEEDFKTFLEQNRQYWDYVDDQLLERMKGAARVKFYVTDDADGKKQLETWMAGIDAPYATARLREEDWATSWQKYYKPMSVGERLYIVPEWEKGEPVPAGRTPLYLNPGLIFGLSLIHIWSRIRNAGRSCGRTPPRWGRRRAHRRSPDGCRGGWSYPA